MRSVVTVIVLALHFKSFADHQLLMQDAIQQPVMGLRCKELIKERAEKVKFQQRLNGLLQRNHDLIKKTSKTQSGLSARIKSNEIEIKNELHMVNLQIKTMEENIVRSGCPGISL